jgi:hypothetical protein
LALSEICLLKVPKRRTIYFAEIFDEFDLVPHIAITEIKGIILFAVIM